MAILLAWINIVVVLLHVTVIQGAGEPEFTASVPKNVLATYDGTPGSSSVTLPCTLRFTDPTIDPQNMQWRVDLTWFKREFGETQTTNLYIWENNYDDKIDPNETRMSRVKNPFEERYNLRFNDVRAEDEGEYCCYLHINTNPSSTACTNLRYKAFQNENLILDWDATDNLRATTDRVNCSANGSPPPPMNVQIKNFYPKERTVEIYAPAINPSAPICYYADWTNFTDNTDGTFNVNFTCTWPTEYECGTLGNVTFLISLTHELSGDEAFRTGRWIPLTTTAPTTTGDMTITPAGSEPTSDRWWLGTVIILGIFIGVCVFILIVCICFCCIIIKKHRKKHPDFSAKDCHCPDSPDRETIEKIAVFICTTGVLPCFWLFSAEQNVETDNLKRLHCQREGTCYSV